MEGGDGPGALQQFDRAIAAFEEYAPAHYQRGLTLWRLGQTAQSRAAFARAQALNPSLVPPKELK
jgi:tetratricopeptide (TPR) repeat protein